MKHFDPATTNIVAVSKPMTRKEKISRLIGIVQNIPRINNPHQWEYLPQELRESYTMSGSIMEIAANDPIFQDAGLTNSTVGEFCRFFEISPSQFHDMACFCRHGEISTGHSYALSLGFIL